MIGINSERGDKQEHFERVTGRLIAPRDHFLAAFRAAVEGKLPFAAARIGISEKHWTYYPTLLSDAHRTKRLLYEDLLRFHGLSQAGVFPADPEFYLAFNAIYMEHVRELDILGLVLDPLMDPDLVTRYALTNTLLYYKDLRPDRSSPSNPANCYLPALRGLRVLLVCPFAQLLAERANRQTFEGVWARSGTRWFEPAAIEALEFPYGFSKETQLRYASSLDMLDDIANALARRSFDVAMIAAAGLTIPIASVVKRMGRIAVSSGSYLQLLFGVKGARWRHREDWQRDHFTDSWIDMPSSYRPKEAAKCDGGAYW